MSEIEGRLKKNIKKCQQVMKDFKTSACRLYDRDLPNYPFIVEIFCSKSPKQKDQKESIHAVLTTKWNHKIDEDKGLNFVQLIDALNRFESLKIDALWIKNRRPQRQNLNSTKQYKGEGQETTYLNKTLINDYLRMVHKIIQEDEQGNAKEGSHFTLTLDKVLRPLEKLNQQNTQDFQEEIQSMSEGIISEGDRQYHVNFYQHMDTGLFLDHRPLRRLLPKILREQIEYGKRKFQILNLFSYTCSLGLSLIEHDVLVTNVDLSKRYLEWGQKNEQLNRSLETEKCNKSNYKYECYDIFHWMKFYQSTANQDFKKYDLIIIDPPTFSTSTKMQGATWDVQRDHESLILSLKEHFLTKDGVIVFSNNLRGFKLSESLKETKNFKRIKDWTTQSFDRDFHDQKLHQVYILE